MCRCGGTNTKPYCDGAHAKIGFKAEAKEIVVSE
jgi:CDGSH-type Zn-finger protein